MSSHTYIFEEIEILVYGSGRHFEFGAKNWISPNRIDGDFFLMLIHTFLKLLTKYQLYIILFGVIKHFDFTTSCYRTLSFCFISCIFLVFSSDTALLHIICIYAFISSSLISSPSSFNWALDSVSANVKSRTGFYSRFMLYLCNRSSIRWSLAGAFESSFFIMLSNGLWSEMIVTSLPYTNWWNLSHPNSTAKSSFSMIA